MITPTQCKAARALAEMKQVDLAEAAGISNQTIVDFERGARQPHRNNLAALQSALEVAGVVFIEADESGGVGVRLKD
ncbi:helix-turn-helix transcriptional regulator [Pelagibius litoralis]|uniref:Helix-turn-helix transcriptional regulator n=1 Tax=Pelagibius litoralis TaxID=374515 RepID=A0A967KCF5_9PROT|nr:helix-turn-helix transcriptional regulator [Pelagibius litoralis]NIA69645.1 helix-turn-helix transcriptional regulator [Pelagibius litoralis]